IEASIKGWQIDDPKADVSPMGIGQINDLGLGLLVFEFDLVADQSQRRAGGSVCAGGDNGKSHFCALWSADELYSLIEAHVDHVNGRLVTLGYGDDFIVFFDFLALGSGTAGKQAMNDAIAIVGGQFGTDTEKTQVHPNGKPLELRMPEIIRVRIVDV